MCYLRMAVMHLPTKFCANSAFQFKVIDIFQNPRRRPPSSWIFKWCTFGTFPQVNSVVLELYIKFGSNICDGHWDQHTYALDVHLMTSRELTSGFEFWSRGHLRMAVVHLPIKFGVDICIQSKVIDIIPKFKMAAATILDFQFMWIWILWRVGSVVFVFCTTFGSNICYNHRDRRTCFRPLFDDVTQINFRFRLLVMWSSLHGRDASSHEIWCRYAYPIRSYWYFSEIMVAAAILDLFGWTMGPPTKPHSWCVPPVKILSRSTR